MKAETLNQRTFTEREVAEAFAAFVKECLQLYAPADVIRSYVKTFATKLVEVEDRRPVSVYTPVSIAGPPVRGTMTFTVTKQDLVPPTLKNPGNAQYAQAVEAAAPPAKAPHCDRDVLHAPGKCKFCDEYNTRQNLRQRNGVNFTGESKPGLKPCPSDARRGFGVAERWNGNKPRPAGPPERKTGQIWKVWSVLHPYKPALVRLGARRLDNRGWQCDNLNKFSFFAWINDCHWTDTDRYQAELVQDA